MAKQPIEVRDSFNFTIMGVTTEQLGELVAVVTKMGFTQTRHELVTDVISYKHNKHHDVKAEDFLIAWVEDNPTFKAIEAVEHFRSNGRTDGAAYTALRLLADKGALKKLSAGNYARADVKAIEAGKHTKKPGMANAQRYEVSNVDFIVKFAKRHHGKFTTQQLKDAFEVEGRNRDSVSPACGELLEKKLIKRVDKGTYVLTAKPAEVPKTTIPNGNGTDLFTEEAA